MSKSGWGGRRKGAGSGGARPGAGPKRKYWNSGGPETHWVMERQTLSALDPFHPPEMWRVLRVGIDEIEFQCGDDIIVLRRPDDESEEN